MNVNHVELDTVFYSDERRRIGHQEIEGKARSGRENMVVVQIERIKQMKGMLGMNERERKSVHEEEIRTQRVMEKEIDVIIGNTRGRKAQDKTEKGELRSYQEETGGEADRMLWRLI